MPAYASLLEGQRVIVMNKKKEHIDEFNLIINDCCVEIGSGIRSEEFKTAKIKRCGFFARRMLKSQTGEEIFWAKNCIAGCFQREFMLLPNIRSSSRGMAYATTAYLYFLGSHIAKITVQCWGSNVTASFYAREFRKMSNNHLGDPAITNRVFHVWTIGDTYLISEYDGHSDKNYIHWVKTDSPYRLANSDELSMVV